MRQLGLMLFRVTVSLVFVDSSTVDDIDFNAEADDEDSLKELITPGYIMRNVSNDWGPRIRNVTIEKACAILKAHNSE